MFLAVMGSEELKMVAKSNRLVCFLVVVALSMSGFLVACSSPVVEPDVEGSPLPTGGDDNQPTEGICLLNNCNADSECTGCSDGRTSCLVEENRCVACNPISGEGCADGESCSPYGICVPAGLTCDTDPKGNPTVSCGSNADCKACSPMHQVCDTATSRCQACTATNTQHCLQSDFCADTDADGRPETCSAKCPSSCTVDNDCGQCGGPGNEAHACNAHKCAECSDTYPCAAGLECQAGSCVPGCGIAGPVSGSCLSNEDCSFCGDPNAPANEKWQCNKAINSNEPSDHGMCAPPAAGCSDLGKNVAVLPAPWNGVTNLCSHDPDCAGVGIDLNVGEMVRDLVGSDKLNLGFTKVKINDANIKYKMSKCADIDLTKNISCGVCVPCEVDADCSPIALDPVVMDLFKGDPLAQIAGALLLDLLYGDEPSHDLNFFCQPVAAGYGVCAPCSNPLQACGTGSAPSSGNHGESCDHGVCEIGAKLNAGCDSCSAQVCGADPYCCSTDWDQLCVDQAKSLCGANVCNGGGNGGSCAHPECSPGAKLTPGCSSCAAAVCGAEPYCCDTDWDQLCVDQVAANCGSNFCGGGGGNPPPNSCAHPECTEGEKLNPGCSSCATAVCGADPYCCDNDWDSICVGLVPQECGANFCGSQQQPSCAHSECSNGAKLDANCSSCAGAVCAADSYCCDTEWDNICVGLVSQHCGASTCGNSCAHDECSAGEKLDPNCSSCAGDVCAQDAYCCDTDWDSICIDIAKTKASCSC